MARMSQSPPSDAFKGEIEQLTSEIVTLLRDHPYQANTMACLGESVRLRPNEIAAAYRDGAIWGGSGSVCDVSFSDRAADAAKCRLLVRLVECFELEGYHYEGASQMAAIYRRWLKDGIFEKTPTIVAPSDVPRGFEIIRRRLGLKPRH